MLVCICVCLVVLNMHLVKISWAFRSYFFYFFFKKNFYNTPVQMLHMNESFRDDQQLVIIAFGGDTALHKWVISS